MLARPPTSRPPIAFGWPVTLNGPMPGRPMRPVARWKLMIAFTLSVPQADWFTPWLKTVTTFSAPIQRSRKPARSPRREAGDGGVAGLRGGQRRGRSR